MIKEKCINYKENCPRVMNGEKSCKYGFGSIVMRNGSKRASKLECGDYFPSEKVLNYKERGLEKRI